MKLEDIFRNIKSFEWDEGNRDKNWQKHQVDWKECEEVFLNGRIKIYYDLQHSADEERYTVFGKTRVGRLLTIIFTIRNSKICVISARDQDKKERKEYEKED